MQTDKEHQLLISSLNFEVFPRMASSISPEKIQSLNELPGPRPSLPFIGTSWIYFPIVGKLPFVDGILAS